MLSFVVPSERSSVTDYLFVDHAIMRDHKIPSSSERLSGVLNSSAAFVRRTRVHWHRFNHTNHAQGPWLGFISDSRVIDALEQIPCRLASEPHYVQ